MRRRLAQERIRAHYAGKSDHDDNAGADNGRQPAILTMDVFRKSDELHFLPFLPSVDDNYLIFYHNKAKHAKIRDFRGFKSTSQETLPRFASTETVAPSVRIFVQFSQERIAGISSAMATVAA